MGTNTTKEHFLFCRFPSFPFSPSPSLFVFFFWSQVRSPLPHLIESSVQPYPCVLPSPLSRSPCPGFPPPLQLLRAQPVQSSPLCHPMPFLPHPLLEIWPHPLSSAQPLRNLVAPSISALTACRRAGIMFFFAFLPFYCPSTALPLCAPPLSCEIMTLYLCTHRPLLVCIIPHFPPHSPVPVVPQGVHLCMFVHRCVGLW